jgi:hypothetical protein
VIVGMSSDQFYEWKPTLKWRKYFWTGNSPIIYDLAFIKSNCNVFMLIFFIFIFYLNARSYRKCQNIRSTFRCHFKSGADSQVNPLHTPRIM